VATLLLTTEALISNVPEKKKAPAGGHDHDHGGMGGMGGMGDMDF
jgi:chaperonin GroEL